MAKKVFFKTFYFNEEDYATLELFNQIILKDKNIWNSVPENKKKITKKNGMLSFGLRWLITDYVNRNKEAFLRTKNKPKEELKEVLQDAKSEDNNSQEVCA